MDRDRDEDRDMDIDIDIDEDIGGYGCIWWVWWVGGCVGEDGNGDGRWR